jgi:hypothetical protein
VTRLCRAPVERIKETFVLQKNLGERYTPLYFLSALGAGGLSVAFFINLMFLVPHPNTPMPTFHDFQALLDGAPGWKVTLLGLDLLAMTAFAVLHLLLLWWNLREFRAFRRLPAYERLKNSNDEVALMAVPLTLTMTVNVFLVNAMSFVPNLWSATGVLFPLGVAVFLLIGLYGLYILGVYFVRMLVDAEFDFAENNSLAPMIAIFALSMTAVGLATPAAMSKNHALSALGIGLSLFFATIAVLLMVIKLVLGFGAMLQHGIKPAAAGSLWVMIPVMTLLGITTIRILKGLEHGFGLENPPALIFLFVVGVLSVQILFGLIGFGVMKRLDYFEDYAGGRSAAPGAFALVCPGVAFFVFGMFFISFGLTQSGLIGHLSLAYFAFMIPFVLVKVKTILVYFRLLGKLVFVRREVQVPIPAS